MRNVHCDEDYYYAINKFLRDLFNTYSLFLFNFKWKWYQILNYALFDFIFRIEFEIRMMKNNRQVWILYYQEGQTDISMPWGGLRNRGRTTDKYMN